MRTIFSNKLIMYYCELPSVVCVCFSTWCLPVDIQRSYFSIVLMYNTSSVATKPRTAQMCSVVPMKREGREDDAMPTCMFIVRHTTGTTHIVLHALRRNSMLLKIKTTWYLVYTYLLWIIVCVCYRNITWRPPAYTHHPAVGQPVLSVIHAINVRARVPTYIPRHELP